MALTTNNSTSFADPEGFQEAADLLADTERITVLTGAGVSTDSGIPDFRGPQGLWTTNPGAQALSDIDTYMGDVNVRREVWLRRRADQARKAEPNAAHRACPTVNLTDRLHALSTQNVAGIHQKGGVPADRVKRVHRTTLRVMCMACGLRTPSAGVLGRLDEESGQRCVECGGIEKCDPI